MSRMETFSSQKLKIEFFLSKIIQNRNFWIESSNWGAWFLVKFHLDEKASVLSKKKFSVLNLEKQINYQVLN